MDQGSLSDDVVSMVDVLQEDNDLEEEANAVLGDSDDQHCTYAKGIVNRQALYACGTCTPPTSDPAGVCLACSLTCHENHELYELYTKRNFRCDCGNSKFGDIKCKLYPDKDPINASNSYNQNFTGAYCTCHRPYPDQDDEIEDEMIQCIVCEDWYHSRHLGCLPPAGGDYQEMICDSCMDRCPFLQAYLPLSVPSISSLGPSQQVITKDETNGKVDIGNHEDKRTVGDNERVKVEDEQSKADSKSPPETISESVQSINEKNSDESKPSPGAKGNDAKETVTPVEDKDKAVASPSPGAKENGTTPVGTTPVEDKDKAAASPKANESGTTEQGKPAEGVSTTDKAAVSPSSDCKLVQLQACVTDIKKGPSYWNIGWRSQLCKCTSCMALYSSLGVSYLADEQDSLVAYEERGQARQAAKMSSYESGMQALGDMGRINQVEAIHEYNDLKNELTEYLREFANQGKVVQSEDIKSFFESMQSRKRQRVGSANTVQYSCK